MIYILLSISCSVTVAVLLKLAKRYKINVLQAVLSNYLFAIILGCIFFRPDIKSLTVTPSLPYIALGILLPVLFLILAASVRRIGIVKTDIAQRLSLFIPIIASLYLFGETFNGLKIAGLIVGFSAIFFTLTRPSTVKTQNNNYVYPILVFIGFGIIDILFKQLAGNKAIPYTTAIISVFCISFIVALIAITYTVLIKKQKIELINLICGGILGVFNFGNILFYMKAHRAMADNPSTVFAAMNMGVILAGSVIGIIIFKEKVSKLNILGIILALAAIILITLSQQHAV